CVQGIGLELVYWDLTELMCLRQHAPQSCKIFTSEVIHVFAQQGALAAHVPGLKGIVKLFLMHTSCELHPMQQLLRRCLGQRYLLISIDFPVGSVGAGIVWSCQVAESSGSKK